MITRARGQITLIDVTDAYAANLSVQSFTFIGNGSTPLGVLSQQSFSVKVTGLRGAEAVAAAVNISALTLPTGLTVTSDNHLTAPTLTFTATTSLTVTTLAAVGNMVTLPVVLDGGKVTLNRAISLQIAPTGVGVDELVTQYYLSTSDSTQTGGSWSATPAAYVAGRYYWKRDKVDWTDGTTSYTDPVLDNALTNANANALEASQKVDDLEIGGRNLFGYGSECESLAGLTNSGFEIVTEDGFKCAHASGELNVQKNLRSKIPFTPKPNEVMTISAWVKIKNIVYGTEGQSPMCGFYLSGQTIDGRWRAQDAVAAYLDGEKQTIATAAQIFTQLISDTNWHKVAYVGKFQNYEFTANLVPGVYLRNATGDLYVRNIKYERGNKPTDWTPAPEDIDADITAVETIANNAMTAANGKNTIYHQSTQPTGTFTEGDTWFDTANDYAMYTWDGTAWVLEQFGEDSIAAGAIKAGHIDSGAVTADKIAANAITAAMISGKDITGGTFRTTLGDSLYFQIENTVNGAEVDPYTPADPEQVYSKLQAQGLFNLIISNDTEVNRSKLVPCIFSAGAFYPRPSEFTGDKKYGWFADHFVYAERFYSEAGKLISLEETRAYRGMNATDIGVSGLSAVVNEATGIVVLRFESFSFAAGTNTDSTAYHLPVSLYPAAQLDLVSTHNGVRFKINNEGYIQPYTAVPSSGNTAIRGSFTYIAFEGF